MSMAVFIAELERDGWEIERIDSFDAGGWSFSARSWFGMTYRVHSWDDARTIVYDLIETGKRGRK